MSIRTITTLVSASTIALAATAALAENNKEQDAQSKPSNQERRQKASQEGNAAIRLQSIFVGDKEQPAISYFIPWQGIGAPDQLYWNVEERHDEVLDTVDREIMLRSMRLYGELDLEANGP